MLSNRHCLKVKRHENWRDGFVIKCTGCSSRSGFNLKYSNCGSQKVITPAQGISDALFQFLWTLYTCNVKTNIQVKYITHKINNEKAF